MVVSSAVRPTNPEIAEAARRGIPVIPRAEMLAELMRMRFSIAVAGAHGKTTTTSMIAFVLARGGLDPDAVIGGRLRAFGSNARLGRGEYMVAEADESDRSFLMLWPSIAVITNIDREHMESYGSFEELQQAFADFANKVPFYGGCRRVRRRPECGAGAAAASGGGCVTYGVDQPAGQFRGHGGGGRNVRRPLRGVSTPRGRRPSALARSKCRCPGATTFRTRWRLSLSLPRSAFPFDEIAGALEEFEAPERRFERHGEAGGVLVVDDYAHHPTEIAAVLAAARTALARRLIVAFQPHRYTRTQQLMDEFGQALKQADEVVLADIYPASEDPIAWCDGGRACGAHPADRAGTCQFALRGGSMTSSPSC